MSEALGNALAGTRCSIKPGGGNRHLRLAGCDDCNVREFARMPLDKIEELYHAGYVRQPIFEAYMHVWATSAPRFSSLGDNWTEAPTDPEVVALVELFRQAVARKTLNHLEES